MIQCENVENYRVQPGEVLDIPLLDPTDQSLWPEGSKEVHKKVFKRQLAELQELQNVLYAEGKHKVLVVMQAMDAGGKDGCVKKVFASMDPQGVQVSAFKAPSKQELAHDFLWRVHQKVPAKGMVSVFNRSHYEDVIAVRVKQIFGEEVWGKRYDHIRNFEQMLADEGTTIVKIFLNISKEEQRERLQDRLDDPSKWWKFNPGDLEDRARWDEFMQVYSDVLAKTSTPDAPWYVVPANKKWYRNIAVAQIIINALKEQKMEYPKVEWDADTMRVE